MSYDYKHRNEVKKTERGKGFLVLNRREGDWTTVKLKLSREQLLDLLDGKIDEVGLAFRVYNLSGPDDPVGASVDVAFDDPNRYFQIDRPERFHRSNKKEED